MVSKLQGVVAKATFKNLKKSDYAVRLAKENANVGLTYHSWAISWDDAMVVTVADASFAQ